MAREIYANPEPFWVALGYLPKITQLRSMPGGLVRSYCGISGG